MSSIFVQLASYHDYELGNTISDAIKTSSGSNVLNFGVSSCYYEKNEIDVPLLQNVKCTVSAAPSSIGLGVGRMLAHRWYDGENYYFQIDSHTRFTQDWDVYLISEVKRFQSLGLSKPLITMYPMNYRYRDDGSVDTDLITTSGGQTKIVFTENPAQFREILIPTQRADANTDGNVFSKSVSGGCIFTVGGFIKPNPKIAFYGEEIFIAARAFTNGFDMVIPSKGFMYHLYYDHKRQKESRRRLVWSDFPEKFSIMDEISKNEIRRMFTDNIVGERHLGVERSLEDYEIYSGLNFKTGEIVEC